MGEHQMVHTMIWDWERYSISCNPFPEGSNSKEKVKLSSEQMNLPRDKLSVAPIDNRVDRSNTQCKEISLPSGNDKIKGTSFTKKDVR